MSSAYSTDNCTPKAGGSCRSSGFGPSLKEKGGQQSDKECKMEVIVRKKKKSDQGKNTNRQINQYLFPPQMEDERNTAEENLASIINSKKPGSILAEN
jgi:hypothetical protein